MKTRLLLITTIGMAALISAPAIAQSPPPPGPPATMQPIANPPEAPMTMHAMKKHHARKMARKMAKKAAKEEAAAAAPAQ
jgi:hypothetical protein